MLITSEPPHDKTNNVAVRPAKSLGIHLPVERTAKTLIRQGGCPGWSESVWVHTHFVGFVMRRLICNCFYFWLYLLKGSPTLAYGHWGNGVLKESHDMEMYGHSSFGPRQVNLVLIAYASSEGSHPRSIARTSATRSYKQCVKRNLQTESQVPGPSEWLGMRS